MSSSSSQREQPQTTLDRSAQQEDQQQEDDVPRSHMVDPVDDRQDPAAYAFNDPQQEEEQDGQGGQDSSASDDDEELSTEDETPRSDSGSSTVLLLGPNCDCQADVEQDGVAWNLQERKEEKVVEQVFQYRAIEVQKEEDESYYEDGTSDDSSPVDPTQDGSGSEHDDASSYLQEEQQDGQEGQDDGNEDDSSASETDDEEELPTEDETPRSDSGSSSIPLFGPNCDCQAAAEQDGAASNQQKEKVVEQVFQDRAIEVQEEEDESSYEDGTSDDSSPVDSTQDGSILAVDDPSSYLQEEVIQDPTTQEELPVEDVTKVTADSSRTILMTEKTLEPPIFESPSEEEEYLSPEPETVAPPVAVLPPTKERVTNLKYWFEARAKELEPKPVPRFRKGGYKSRRGASRLSKRVGVFNPELLSWHEKKHLFERKIGQSRRWSEEIDQAKAKAKARGGGGRGSSSKKF